MIFIKSYKIFESIEEEKMDIIKKASKYKNIEALKRSPDSDLYRKICTYSLVNSIWPRAPKWTIEKIKEEAKKYSNRSEFQRLNSAAYARATGLKMMDELFPNVVDIKASKEKKKLELKDKIRLRAKEYNTLVEFIFHDKEAYKEACELGMLPELFPRKK